MIYKNFDGIKKSKSLRPKAKVVKALRLRNVDGLMQRPAVKVIRQEISIVKPFFVAPFKIYNPKNRGLVFWHPAPLFRNLTAFLDNNFSSAAGFLNPKIFYEKWSWVYRQQRVPVLAAVLALIIAFGGGVWATLNTRSIAAEAEPQALEVSTDQSAGGAVQTSNSEVQEQNVLAVSNNPVATSAGGKIPNEALFNLTIDQLEVYLNEALKTPEVKQAEILAKRKDKLKFFLAEKNSPFVDIVNTLAELKHWKLVLAISNSESTLGKRCYTNNCSGIGVEPGYPLWREYSSTAEWAKDLDRLIEKRYKDWTLEEMNGVYNKPGSDNWILAAEQVLQGLNDRRIE